MDDLFGIRHAMLFMLDGPAGRLYAVAIRGYEESGVGSEIAVGDGVIGVAASLSRRNRFPNYFGGRRRFCVQRALIVGALFERQRLRPV